MSDERLSFRFLCPKVVHIAVDKQYAQIRNNPKELMGLQPF